ncbi:hypothetical protein J6590_072961 [Homalodisca vitripennis]|nr:hypothetical protein J6590_072961 [Homalodisca vitripennis]
MDILRVPGMNIGLFLFRKSIWATPHWSLEVGGGPALSQTTPTLATPNHPVNPSTTNYYKRFDRLPLCLLMSGLNGYPRLNPLLRSRCPSIPPTDLFLIEHNSNLTDLS